MPNTILNIGWEANPLFNNGASLFTKITRGISITGFQIGLSMATSGKVGICEVLACGSIAPPGPAPTFSGLPSYPGPTLQNPDFAPAVLNNPGNVPVGGFVGYTGYLFSTILKTVSDQAINQCIVREGLNIVLPAGSYLIFHMDHAGTNSADCEMQGALNYV